MIVLAATWCSLGQWCLCVLVSDVTIVCAGDARSQPTEQPADAHPEFDEGISFLLHICSCRCRYCVFEQCLYLIDSTVWWTDFTADCHSKLAITASKFDDSVDDGDSQSLMQTAWYPFVGLSYYYNVTVNHLPIKRGRTSSQPIRPIPPLRVWHLEWKFILINCLQALYNFWKPEWHIELCYGMM